MANIVSPGVYVIEKDISTYPATIDSTTVGIVGFAEKGPTNEATLITSQERLIETFGEPRADMLGQGIMGGLEILEASNRVYYVRVVSDDAAAATATVKLGGCPAIAVKKDNIGVTENTIFKVAVTDNAGASGYPFVKTYRTGVDPNTNQARALAKTFGTDLDDLKVMAAFDYEIDGNGNIVPKDLVANNVTSLGFIVGAFAGASATLSVSAYDVDGTTPVDVLYVLDASGNPSGAAVSTATVKGWEVATGSASYKVSTLYEGAGYNLGAKPDGSVSGNSIEIDGIGGPKFFLTVNENGATKESFKVSFLNNQTFIDDVVGTDISDNLSEVVKGKLYEGLNETTSEERLPGFASQLSDLLTVTSVSATTNTTLTANTNPRFIKMVQGSYPLANGDSGAPTSNYAEWVVGNSADKTGIYALDDDLLNLTVAVIPGLNDQSIQNALITLAEQSQNFIACVAPPIGAIDTPQEAIDWSNGLSETRTAAINSSYAAIYWPWVQTFIPTLGEDKWIDPAVYGARQIAYTAGVAELWFAPAGFVRGRLTKPSRTEVPLNQGDRDSMYSGGNVINPIVNFPQQGITIFGQRTAQRSPTALDRINVRMLMIYIRKVLLLSTQRFAFEPNDAILWSQIEETVNPLLDDIKRRRGITEFRVVCDATVNTPVRIDRNEVWCKILIKPTKAAEAVIFELNITSQSAKISG